MQMNLDHFPNLCVNVLFLGSSQVFDNPRKETQHQLQQFWCKKKQTKKPQHLKVIRFSRQNHHISLVQHLNLSLLSSSWALHCLPRETSLCTGTLAAMSESHQLYSGDRTRVGLWSIR